MGDVIPALDAAGKYFSVENPWRSIVWLTDEMKKISALEKTKEVYVDMCVAKDSRLPNL